MIESLNPQVILGVIIGYFFILMGISYWTSKGANNKSFFLANRESPWYLVAFGMIGASLSGVTFISVPGWVGDGPVKEIVDGAEVLFYNGNQFAYMQMVLGYLVGYFIIATVLMPMYYRLQLTSIYTYLEQRFGFYAYKTGAGFFLLSRTIGASFRLYLVAIVLQAFVMDYYGIPFWTTVLLAILLIWIYTYRGGIKTIVWTDTLQTTCMLVAVIMAIVTIAQRLDLDFMAVVDTVSNSVYSKAFFFDNFIGDGKHFVKQFLAGMFIAIVMTGLDQDMMQKNLSCRNLKEAQTNMFTFSIVLVFVNLVFLVLGALLFIYAANTGIELPESSDKLFPTIALEHLSPAVGIVFVLGLIAAAYSSADSALTSLTTSFCVDFLDFEKKGTEENQAALSRTRLLVHIGFSLLLFFVIMIFWAVNNDAVISQVFKVAGYTYGPLLGLYTFGFFTKQRIQDRFAPIVCIAAPILTYVLNLYSEELFFGYKFGFELLLLNGLITFLGLFAISYYQKEEEEEG